MFPGFELVTTTVYNLLDQFIERYGEDAVIPVHRTDIGNLCTSSVQPEPELFRVMAMKGAELILRTASGGFTPADIHMCVKYNSVYTVIVNNAVSPQNPGFMDDAFGAAGGTAVYGPQARCWLRPIRNSHNKRSSASRWEASVPAPDPGCSFRVVFLQLGVYTCYYSAH